MKLLVFGITGSIGNSLLALQSPHQIVGISFNHNVQLAKTIINDQNVSYYYSPSHPECSNVNSIEELINQTNPDMIVNAVTGLSGLVYSVKALQAKKDLCLANKESLVIAGKWINQLAQANGVKIYPIDSEHTALYDLLINQKPQDVKQLIITCSGGSCYHKTRQEVHNTTYNEAIKHPNWNMGAKISMDSCTLMNKCFEIVEAYHLFGLKNIIAVQHTQSIVHAMVQFTDHTIFANMSKPDMKTSIDLALHKFTRPHKPQIEPLSFNHLNLSFNEIDIQKWKPIQWAYDIINDERNNLGLIINYANEKAIAAFQQNKIKLDEFYDYIETYITLAKKAQPINSLEECLNAIELIENGTFESNYLNK